ncbi:N-acetylmuramoyl-L-alanine amidase [Limimaricola litoreus]|uniref:N-acetylmuramoyl-L-alanine amidase n=1 Tax=Limimaricola litoreus TaxID=2955316 RepID=A0A9X2FV17_9RHOB|nr:N-acetylmuramoyl-L-alanine amidase [Limimaricola litoreus]MCP1168158.1 N-acetylmuramoyl-L-alanine amidase [Limimaricola litoreus]
MPLSPNHGPRRLGARPDLVVIHYTAMTSHDAALERLCDPAAEVSAHWLISGAGDVTALVPEELRAWHAGAGRWGAVDDVNSRSIGIELYNRGDHPFAGPQMAELEALLSGVMERWRIPPERVIGHSDMAPGRKDDPGPRFDWKRLARHGLSIWPEAGQGAAPSARGFDDLARIFGYTADVSHAERLAAFRLRFRPHAAGPVDATDMALVADLAARFPVDRHAPAA